MTDWRDAPSAIKEATSSSGYTFAVLARRPALVRSRRALYRALESVRQPEAVRPVGAPADQRPRLQKERGLASGAPVSTVSQQVRSFAQEERMWDARRLGQMLRSAPPLSGPTRAALPRQGSAFRRHRHAEHSWRDR